MSFISIGDFTDITVTNFCTLPGMMESQLTILGNAPVKMKKATCFGKGEGWQVAAIKPSGCNHRMKIPPS